MLKIGIIFLLVLSDLILSIRFKEDSKIITEPYDTVNLQLVPESPRDGKKVTYTLHTLSGIEMNLAEDQGLENGLKFRIPEELAGTGMAEIVARSETGAKCSTGRYKGLPVGVKQIVMTITSLLATLFSIIATVTTFSYFSFAAFQTRKAALNKSHGSASEFIPILATFINTIFWFKYGFILGDVVMSVVNGFGLILALYSALIYHQHTAHRFSCQIFSIVTLSGVLFWLMAISAGWIKLDGVGFCAMISSVCMFAAPLTAIFGILRRHFGQEIPGSPKPRLLNRKRTSVWVPREGISLSMIIVSAAVSCSWFAYGLVIRDKFVAVPNGLGLFMCLIQYGVWSISYPTALTPTSELSGVANSNNSSRADSKNSLLTFFKQRPDSNRDPLLLRPNSVSPVIEMKNF